MKFWKDNQLYCTGLADVPVGAMNSWLWNSCYALDQIVASVHLCSYCPVSMFLMQQNSFLGRLNRHNIGSTIGSMMSAISLYQRPMATVMATIQAQQDWLNQRPTSVILNAKR